MDKFNRQTKLSVIAVPDYLITSLQANGMTLDYIDSTVGKLDGYEVHKHGHLVNEIMNKLSLNDIADLTVCNEILNNNVFQTNEIVYRSSEDRPHGVETFVQDLYYNVMDYGLNEDARKNIISLYCDKDIDTDTIIMSKNKSEIEKVCSFVKTDDTLFVIFHSGFTNFLVYGGEFRTLISKYIIDNIVSGYGEDRAVTSSVFKSFLRLV